MTFAGIPPDLEEEDGEVKGEEPLGPTKKLKQNLVSHLLSFDGLKPGLMYRLRVAGVSSIGQVITFSFSLA